MANRSIELQTPKQKGTQTPKSDRLSKYNDPNNRNNYEVKTIEKAYLNQKTRADLISQVEIFKNMNCRYLYLVKHWEEDEINLFLYTDSISGVYLNVLMESHLLCSPGTHLAVRIKICRGLMYGLHYLHNQDIVHGYICPQHIIVKNLDEVAMFHNIGIQSCLDCHDQRKIRESAYTSPEVKDTFHLGRVFELTKVSDIYSLGLVFYEIITLKSALDWNSNGEQELKNVNHNLAFLLRRMLQTDPEKRITAPEAFTLFSSSIHIDKSLPTDYPILPKRKY